MPPHFHVEGVGAMGRGRQKAKQTKVARQLKYYSPGTDYRALEAELTGHDHRASSDVATDTRWEAPSDEDDDGRWPSAER